MFTCIFLSHTIHWFCCNSLSGCIIFLSMSIHLPIQYFCSLLPTSYQDWKRNLCSITTSNKTRILLDYIAFIVRNRWFLRITLCIPTAQDFCINSCTLFRIKDIKRIPLSYLRKTVTWACKLWSWKRWLKKRFGSMMFKIVWVFHKLYITYFVLYAWAFLLIKFFIKYFLKKTLLPSTIKYYVYRWGNIMHKIWNTVSLRTRWTSNVCS